MRVLKYLVLTLLVANLSFSDPPVEAAINPTIDPFYIGLNVITWGRVPYPSDFSFGADFSIGEIFWMGPEVSFIVYGDGPYVTTEVGHEVGIRFKIELKRLSPTMALWLSPNFGYTSIQERKYDNRYGSNLLGSTRVQGGYVGFLPGVFLKFVTGANLFLAIGPKYYFLPAESDGVKIRRSGFILDIETSLGLMF